VSRVAAVPGRGEVTTGHIVTIGLDMSEPITVSGAPVVLLNDGGSATYDAARSSTTAAVFDYTVGASDVTTDLVISGIEMVSGASIQDLVGNNANLAGASANLGLQINTKSTGTAGPSGGNLTITGTQDLELFGPSLANVSFAAGSTGTLKLDDSAAFAGTVSGLALGNYVDLADLPYQGNPGPSFTPNGGNTGGNLAVTEGAQTTNIALIGSYLAASFVASSDGHGGTLVTDPPPSQQAMLSQPHV
jgi:hypothetical protein